MLYAPTIKDVARCAGVHFTTVSKALRGNSSIPEATRNRIHTLAQRMGYRRNRIFSALSCQRNQEQDAGLSPSIAYITNRSEANGLYAQPHHAQIIRGAREQAEALGYGFELLSVDEGAHDSASLERHLAERGTVGLILGALERGRRNLTLDWSRYAAVRIDCRHLGLPMNLVSNDQLQSVHTAFRELRALGYSRIGLAVGQQDEEATGDLHLSGLLLAQSRLPDLEQVPPLLFPLGSSHEEATPLLAPWIAANRIDAVLSTWATIDLMLRDSGLDCPGEIACACLCLNGPHPTLAGIQGNLSLVGKRVVSQLAALLREDERGIPKLPVSTLVEGQWMPGASAPRKARGGLS